MPPTRPGQHDEQQELQRLREAVRILQQQLHETRQAPTTIQLLQRRESEKFALMAHLQATLPLRWMAEYLDVSRSGFYNWLNGQAERQQRHQEQLQFEDLVEAIFHEFDGRYGSPRLHRELQTRGIPVGRYRVMNAMRDRGLVARP
jgi:hypothetical protein